MKIITINIRNPNPEIVKEVAEVIRAGGAVAFPTDTAYGIAVNALDYKALARLDRIKGRQDQKPYPIAVLNCEEAERYAIFNKQAKILARHFWPGALTLILKRKEGAEILDPHLETIGVRVPDSKLCNALSKVLGFPYTITSANISGMPTAYTVREIAEQFLSAKYKPDLILDGGELVENKISTVVDLSHGKAKILREGEIEAEIIERVVNENF
ncbi:MAG: L-threonylcarbamoyladenylate synthase [Patescibacteria group bacterium]|nr:L-threonylcarbamoyladenylate synthase [Patescibacteria group bacterium]